MGKTRRAGAGTWQSLPARNKLAPVQHHAALPWPELPAFYLRLQAADGLGARALEFAVLTAARSGEALGATWAEIDRDAALWTIGGNRMKGSARSIACRCPNRPWAFCTAWRPNEKVNTCLPVNGPESRCPTWPRP